MGASKLCDLYQHRADVKEQKYDHNLVYRKQNVSTETVRILVKHGADVTARDGTHSTPLHLASSRGSHDIVRLLIKYGAGVNTLNGNHSSSLHLALAGINSRSTSRRMHQLAEWSDSEHSPYHEDKPKVNTDAVRVLLENGADVTVRDATHSMPLHLASSEGSPEIVRLLIEHGADVTARDNTHSTPLHLASKKGSAENARLLIKHGADVDALDGTHSTPLHLASSVSFKTEGRLLHTQGLCERTAQRIFIIPSRGGLLEKRNFLGIARARCGCDRTGQHSLHTITSGVVIGVS